MDRYSTTLNLIPIEPLVRPLFWAACVTAALLLLSSAIYCSPQSAESDDNTLVIESSPDMDIISFSKSVKVKKEAKSVLVLGADVIVEGRVEGDVAAIGGSVIQKDGAYVGGDVIVIGGKYTPESAAPIRGEDKQTIIFAAYEQQLKDIAQNPLDLFSPTFSVAFFALRAISLLFWFLISLVFATVAPGAVSRAVSRVKLSSAKVVGVGLFTFIGGNLLLLAALTVLPNYINFVLVCMGALLVTLAYVFGRVALHVTFGKLLQKHVLPERGHSEAFLVLMGVAVWTVILSLPYIWVFALLGMVSAGFGLVLTAGSGTSWRTR